MRYREIGVIVSNMEVYGDYLKQAFELYEIPAFMDHKRSVLQNSFVEYIRSLLNMAEQNFTYESVFRFLRTDLAGFTFEEVDELENYVLGLGIKGYKRWQEKWVRLMKGMGAEDLERMNHFRVLLVEKVDPLMFVLKQRRKTVRDITLAVYEFMVREELQVRLKRQEEEFQAMGELALAKEYAQVYRIVIELFDKFAELLGEVVTDSTKKNLEMRVAAENGATAGKFDLAKRAKAANLDAIHDTVHEMARDEARHGKAFEGLLKRYFG